MEKEKRDEEIVGRRSSRYETEEINISELEGPTIKTQTKTKKNNKKKPNFVLLLVIFVVVAVLSIIIFTPKITLNGDKELKLTINSEYEELGASAKFVGKDASKSIKVSGDVNTKKVGEYKITYKIKKGLLKASTTRTVKVVNAGPIINLEGEKEVSVCPNKEFEEIGYSANSIDGDITLDNDLTSSVKTKVNNDSIVYSISNDGVTYKTTRKLVREDKESPEIKLNGSSNMRVTVNTAYTEPGYIVTDNCNDDLTDKVVVEGTVDTSTLGDYELKYKVTDEAGNTQEATRKVTVQKEYVKRNASLTCGRAGVIYLTFDDGPSNSTTPKILDILKKYNVKATFFVTNANGGSDAQIKREFDEGHLIALHTDSHEYGKIYTSEEAFFNDLGKISDRVERITGQKSYIQRFPGGSSNTVSRHYSSGIMTRLATEIESKGYNYVDWNVDSRDAEGKNADQIVGYVTGGLSKNYGNVVLMHDIKYTTMNALERIIQYGLNNGYTFDVLDKSVVCHHKINN